MKNFFQNKFDFVVSIGEDCACTSYLRRCKLQHNSYPFDWLTNASLGSRIDLIIDNFLDFFNIEDFKELKKKANNHNDKVFDLYENIKNGFYFYHDFPANIPLEQAYVSVKEKYERRIRRFYKEIGDANKILFIWLSHSKQHTEQEIVLEYKKLKEKFELKEIFLLIIENSQSKSIKVLENAHILMISQDTISDDKKHHYDQTMGNKTNNLRIFRQIKLNLTFEEKVKKLSFSICVALTNLIFVKRVRTIAKGKLNKAFYHTKL